jgi:hypothetical protein
VVPEELAPTIITNSKLLKSTITALLFLVASCGCGKIKLEPDTVSVYTNIFVYHFSSYNVFVNGNIGKTIVEIPPMVLWIDRYTNYLVVAQRPLKPRSTNTWDEYKVPDDASTLFWIISLGDGVVEGPLLQVQLNDRIKRPEILQRPVARVYAR